MSERLSGGTNEPEPTHRWPVRVYYEDTDAAGIVYYANYLKFAERARTEMLRAAGLDHPSLLAEQGGQFAVRRCAIDYHAPARLDDRLEVRTGVTRAAGATLELRQRVYHGDRLLAVLDVTLAFIDARLRPRRLPIGLRAGLAAAADVEASSSDAGGSAPEKPGEPV